MIFIHGHKFIEKNEQVVKVKVHNYIQKCKDNKTDLVTKINDELNAVSNN